MNLDAICCVALLTTFLRIRQTSGAKEQTQLDRTENVNSTIILDALINPNKYDKKARPQIAGKPVKMFLSLAVQSITNIRESNMEFTTSMFLRQEWTDLRLAHGLDGTLSLKGEEVNRIWMPDTYITNNNQYVLHKDNQLALISKYGDVYFSGRMLVMASCQMDLVKFPADVQKCQLVLESFAYTRDHVEYLWKAFDPVVILNSEMAEFDLADVNHNFTDVTYVSGMYRDMIVTFTFQRRLGFYLINFYVPCVMMVIMSWLVFWMDRDNIGDRIALGITTVLTVVFLLGSGNATVPRVSYPKAIDWYLMTSLIFVFVALMMCLLIFRYERGRRPGNDNANSMGHPDTTGTQWCDPLFRSHTTTEWTIADKMSYPMDEFEDRSHVSYYVADQQGAVYPIVRSISGTSSRHRPGASRIRHRLPRFLCGLRLSGSDSDHSCMVNKTCRVLFPIAFVIFNSIYWALILR